MPTDGAMSFAYLPLFTGDYLRDTRHLTPLKHGVFLLALMHCWDSKGPMPLDEQECAGICNCRSADEVDAMRYILGRFFTRMEDGHYNHRMQKEVERSEQISGARSEAGRKGYEARAKHLPSKSQAIAKQVHLSPSPSPSLPPSPENQVPTELPALPAASPAPPAPFGGDSNLKDIPARALVQLAAGWELPEAWGLDAEALGWQPRGILVEAEKFRQYYVSGGGAGKRRNLKGWRQSWSNWLGKAAERVRA